ncbi:MAG: tetratricopeptide repeat protein [Clostridia bacterium]|nr:tetratricopeptide repeat protein [Clostridia bacterium]MBR6096392.1 tetratricopeptide repeat protein [Oscillospiraceae bacterium]
MTTFSRDDGKIDARLTEIGGDFLAWGKTKEPSPCLKAIMQANAGRYDEAIATFSYAETLNDNDPELYYNMAYLYDMVGNTDMYEQCLNKGTALEFENSLKGED